MKKITAIKPDDCLNTHFHTNKRLNKLITLDQKQRRRIYY